jgi:hypothetical protein
MPDVFAGVLLLTSTKDSVRMLYLICVTERVHPGENEFPFRRLTPECQAGHDGANQNRHSGALSLKPESALQFAGKMTDSVGCIHFSYILSLDRIVIHPSN